MSVEKLIEVLSAKSPAQDNTEIKRNEMIKFHKSAAKNAAKIIEKHTGLDASWSDEPDVKNHPLFKSMIHHKYAALKLV